MLMLVSQRDCPGRTQAACKHPERRPQLCMALQVRPALMGYAFTAGRSHRQFRITFTCPSAQVQAGRMHARKAPSAHVTRPNAPHASGARANAGIRPCACSCPRG
jgi:hypothetical protein